MTGMGKCTVGDLHPVDEEVAEIHRRFAGFREGNGIGSCTTRYCSLYERPGILVQYPLRRHKPILELRGVNALDLVTHTLFVEGMVTRRGIYEPLSPE